MPLVEYGSLRQNLKLSEHTPQAAVCEAGYAVLKEVVEKRNAIQDEVYKRNTVVAEKLVRSLPSDTAFTISRRCDESPLQEISYQVVIKSIDEKKGVKNRVNFGIPNTKLDEKPTSFVGFCLRTKLLLRDSETGLLYENVELTENIFKKESTPEDNDLPQIRTAA